MAVKRKVSKNKYLIALLITCAVFVFGLLLGLAIESSRLELIEDKNLEQKIDFNSLQIQYQLVNLFGEEKNCDALKKTFEISVENLENTRKKLEAYEKDSSINKKEFRILKREYTLAQLNFWLLTEKTKDICGLEHATLFYFYADDSLCKECGDQAYILTNLKNHFKGSLLNFAFDSQLTEEPLIKILKQTYNIAAYPSLIINGEKFGGLTSQEIILEKICPTFKEKFELCEGYSKTVWIS
jgi:hypothetical protein